MQLALLRDLADMAEEELGKTALTAANSELYAATQKFDAVVRASPHAIITHDRTAGLDTWNRVGSRRTWDQTRRKNSSTSRAASWPARPCTASRSSTAARTAAQSSSAFRPRRCSIRPGAARAETLQSGP